MVPSTEYLLPDSHAVTSSHTHEPAPAHSFESDGYHYKTSRRRYRHKRGSAAVAVPPVKHSSKVIAPAGVSANAALEERDLSSKIDSYVPQPSGTPQQIEAAASAPETHTLESDGYHYRAGRQYRHRH